MSGHDALRAEFIARFGTAPALFRAPGRVNLIGEHTDYNAGWVMPVAIEFHTTVAIAARPDRLLRMVSKHFGQSVERPLPTADTVPVNRGSDAHWSDYVLGVARALVRHGRTLCGADMLIDGDVPLGAGLSSSAALEVAAALALASLEPAPALAPVTVAQLCQSAENEFVGMRCGIMDQFASACSRKDHALLLDCRSLEHQWVPLGGPAGAGARLVICNSMVRHRLAGGEYNRRRAECERGVELLAAVLPGIETLRDVTPEALRAHAVALDPQILRRCRHVVGENARVLAAAAALRAADLVTFGRLMAESHRSLRDDYEVSSPELDLLVHIASSLDGVYGARMTGGGFGGCTVNWVRDDAVASFCAVLAARYEASSGHCPDIYVCAAADGAAAVGAATAGTAAVDAATAAG